MELIVAMSRVETDLKEQVRELAKSDFEYKKLVNRIGERLVRRY